MQRAAQEKGKRMGKGMAKCVAPGLKAKNAKGATGKGEKDGKRNGKMCITRPEGEECKGRHRKRGKGWEKEWQNVQHPAFPRGPQPQYYPGSTRLNCAVRMGSGDFRVIWPHMIHMAILRSRAGTLFCRRQVNGLTEAYKFSNSDRRLAHARPSFWLILFCLPAPASLRHAVVGRGRWPVARRMSNRELNKPKRDEPAACTVASIS
eukprot:scaffold20571_cov111-Isochrysis_galbana.AAC.11